MSHRFFLPLSLLVAAVALLFGCSKYQEQLPAEEMIQIEGKEISSSSLVPGTMRIQVTEEFADRIEILTQSDGSLSTNVKSVNDAILSMGITHMERLFPYAGEFEPRTRAAGLHLWYTVVFDPDIAFTKAHDDLSTIDGVTQVEYRPRTVLIDNGPAQIVDPQAAYTMSLSQQASSNLPFDDPMLGSQWHYYNDGSAANSKSGADVNVFPAWRKFPAGNNKVIVSVVDGGIDYTHQDLKDNMWHNPEQTGDKVYGWNFVSGGPLVTADNHGTHVAGTISAVNNNGTGVCGIAGGNSATGVQGVLLMSCQIFQGDESGDGATAIKWGADHGAVISQNSWGYKNGTYTPASDKAAIDYFNTYAGMDANGNQTGPMAGGIVVFAAGNDTKNVGYPGEYSGAYAVASIAADYKIAYYSNWGSWVDISAPGGDYKKGAQILSTLPGDKYGWMQGTSMACPHVSGVAALVVANLGKSGFTRAALIDRLSKYAKSLTDYNPNYQMGAGLINAYTSIIASSGNPPEKITDITVDVVSNTVLFKLAIPSDSDDGKPTGINIYYSTKPLSKLTDSLVYSKSYLVGDLNVGDYIEDVLTGLAFNTKYYIAADAYDMSGNRSPLSTIFEKTTGSNHPPVIHPVNGTTITLKQYQTGTLNFYIEEPDYHKFTSVLSPKYPSDTVRNISEDTIQVVITAPKATPGTYTTKLKVTDVVPSPFALSDSVLLSYTILENQPPYVKNTIDNVLFGASGETLTLNMDEYFGDEDGETLTYNTTSDLSVANLNQKGNLIYITAIKYGITTVIVEAVDAMGKSCSSTFMILVRNPEQEIDIYPNPVLDTLYVRMGAVSDVNLSVFNNSGAKVYGEDITISPFSPAKVDMSTLNGGAYSVVVTTSEKVIKRNIVKL